MVKARFATVEDAQAISEICSEAWRITYAELYSKKYIDKVIADFYNIDRIIKECQESTGDWHGYMVAEKDNQVIGCIGGACVGDTGFIYVLYVKPDLKGIGVGSVLLDFLTNYQKEQFGITHQEVNATTDNMMGIPFYEKHGFELLEVVNNWIDESEGTVNHYRRQV
ncbi:MAG: GNAT family N-acetyltransferase [Tissierellia bacterium]|nr:GNAT family N-acetyltransferase [Tissierellia bacterium]